MEMEDIVAVAGGIVTGLGALYAVGRLLRALASRWHRVEEFLGDWSGRPARPGVDREPGVMERLSTVQDGLGAVREQLGEHLSAHGQSANGLAVEPARSDGGKR